ncbi:MAG: hypothetical protein ABEJ23_04150 [Haloarculaceae archaeon]
MFGSRTGNGDVTCVACGTTLERADAREYDKYGNRWERTDKAFEYLCKPCHRDLCHQPRAELEGLLEAAGAGECSRETFLARYGELVEERYGTLEDSHGGE